MNALRCGVLIVAFALEISACAAQATANISQLPLDTYMRIDLAPTRENTVDKSYSASHPGAVYAGAGIVAPGRPVAIPRTADSKFFLLNGMHLGMAIFDVEMTQRCIASHHCRETNPVMPSSQAGQLSVNFAIVAYCSALSYWLRKHNSKLWWLPPAGGAVVHSVGVATGFEHQ